MVYGREGYVFSKKMKYFNDANLMPFSALLYWEDLWFWIHYSIHEKFFNKLEEKEARLQNIIYLLFFYHILSVYLRFPEKKTMIFFCILREQNGWNFKIHGNIYDARRRSSLNKIFYWLRNISYISFQWKIIIWENPLKFLIFFPDHIAKKRNIRNFYCLILFVLPSNLHIQIAQHIDISDPFPNDCAPRMRINLKL